MFNWAEFWAKFWEDFDDDPDKIEDIENIIFKNKNGDWVMIFVSPNESKPMTVKADYNPWSGEELK